jgi:hypothetical protein
LKRKKVNISALQSDEEYGENEEDKVENENNNEQPKNESNGNNQER